MRFFVPLSHHVVVLATAALLGGTFLPSSQSFPWQGGDGDAEDYPPDENFYLEPGEGDVRSPCPALNTLANHGFINRSGKGINILDIERQCNEVFSFKGGILFFLQLPIFNMEYEVSKENGVTIDLDSLYQHGAIEHDASLVREDYYFAGDAEFSMDLFDQCADTRPDDDFLSFLDIVKCSKERVLDTRRRNPTAWDIWKPQPFISIVIEKPFMMLFGNQKDLWTTSKDDLLSFLGNNEIPDGYLPRHERGWGYVGLVSPLTIAPIVGPFLLSLIVNLEGLLRPIKKDYDDIPSDESSSLISSSSSVAEMSEYLVSILEDAAKKDPSMMEQIPEVLVELQDVLITAAGVVDDGISSPALVIAEHLALMVQAAVKSLATEVLVSKAWPAEVVEALVGDYLETHN